MAGSFFSASYTMEEDMSLLSESMTECRHMIRAAASDGYGGTKGPWTAGTEFQAAIVLDNSMEARKAQAAGVRSLYTITTDRATILNHGEIIRREADNQYFRITSSGMDDKTPASAGLDMRQVSAEWLENGLP